jgi:hypothetical protein
MSTMSGVSAVTDFSDMSNAASRSDDGFVPLSQMAHLKRETNYRSPTESIYGCYEEK